MTADEVRRILWRKDQLEVVFDRVMKTYGTDFVGLPSINLMKNKYARPWNFNNDVVKSEDDFVHAMISWKTRGDLKITDLKFDQKFYGEYVKSLVNDHFKTKLSETVDLIKESTAVAHSALKKRMFLELKRRLFETRVFKFGAEHSLNQ